MIRLDNDTIMRILRSRDGIVTHVLDSNGRIYIVKNIAWVRDFGDESEHITTNISPYEEQCPIDDFYVGDIVSVIDPVTGIEIVEIT